MKPYSKTSWQDQFNQKYGTNWKERLHKKYRSTHYMFVKQIIRFTSKPDSSNWVSCDTLSKLDKAYYGINDIEDLEINDESK